jgi:hypothetical protein
MSNENHPSIAMDLGQQRVEVTPESRVHGIDRLWTIQHQMSKWSPIVLKETQAVVVIDDTVTSSAV